MMKLSFRAFVLIVVFFSLVGCQTGGTNKQQTGRGIGAALGGAIGVMAGSGTAGKILAGVAGVAIGGLIGNQIGAYLDEEDQKKMAESTQHALDSGESQSWSNPNTGVKSEVLVSDVPAAPEAQVASTNPQTCREVTQNVTLKDGSTKTETMKACKGPDGAWEII